LSKQSVMVGDKLYEVSVSQERKTVWRALGEFNGKWIEAKGRSRGQALVAWRRRAESAQHHRE
jgi:hypothetical protein